MKLLLLMLVSFSVAIAWEPWIPVPNQDAWWMARFQSNVLNTQINAENINVIFYGDSITEGWGDTAPTLWNQYYAPLGAVNYGIGGDLVQNLLWRVMNGEVNDINLRPRLVVLKIGTVNLNLNYSLESEIARGIIEVVEQLRYALPETRVLVLGVLPRENAIWTDYIERINSIVIQVDDGVNVRFLNMRDAFFNTATGELYTELYRGDGDLMRLSFAGYAVWQQTMNALFQEMMS